MSTFSIFTTVLEPDERLVRSIRSIKSQYPYDHVVTVARNFDKALAMAKEHGWTCRLVSTPGAKISSGFNEAVRRTGSDLLWPLNAGDECVNVDPLVELLANRPEIDIAYGDVTGAGPQPKPKPPPITINTLRWHGMPFCHGAILYRRRLHQRFGYYPENYIMAMDLAFLAKAIAAGCQSAYAPEVVARLEPAGISSQTWKRAVEAARATRPYTPALVSWILPLKWTLFSHAGAFLRSFGTRQSRPPAGS